MSTDRVEELRALLECAERGKEHPYHRHHEEIAAADAWAEQSLDFGRVLLREIDRLRAGGCARDQGTTQFCAEAVAAQEQIARLSQGIRNLNRDLVEQAREARRDGVLGVLTEVGAERARQDARWGVQNHPDTGAYATRMSLGLSSSERYRSCLRAGQASWALILLEEVAEAIEAATSDPSGLRGELVQVAADVR